MPKVKTHSGAKKRFKRTASGKFKFQRVFKRHLLTGRSQKRKRQLRQAGYVPDAHHHQIEVLLPYKD
jgi:large subunit ribosomal protein L35